MAPSPSTTKLGSFSLINLSILSFVKSKLSIRQSLTKDKSFSQLLLLIIFKALSGSVIGPKCPISLPIFHAALVSHKH